MDKEFTSGNNFFTLLLNLSGHLETESQNEKDSIKSLQETLSNVLSTEEIPTLKNNFFSFENSDLYFSEMLPSETIEEVRDLTSKVTNKKGEDELKVFVREVPVRSSQFKGSVPNWAHGAAVENSIGPFVSKDGRNIWFDFYKIIKLVALYFEGQSEPAILFNVSLRKRFINDLLPPVVTPKPKYELVPDSVWVNSKVLASNSPAGFYTGLKIKSGEITLSQSPTLVDGKLTISSTSKITVDLQLEQQELTDTDNESQYGIDARNAQVNTPDRFRFHVTASQTDLEEIEGDIFWNVFGHKASFKYDNADADFNITLNRLLIPLTCSENSFKVNECKSPFNVVSGNADIQLSAWALPSAQLDITKPSQVADNGGLVIKSGKGLSTKWLGLKGGEINLYNPHILADVGRIGITDLQSFNKQCTQEYKLYKDEQNKFGSSVKLQFNNGSPFYYNTFANGTEFLLTQTNSNPLLDRPVTVAGEALDIHSKNSYLMLSVNKNVKMIYLYDDNILFDNYDPAKPKTILPKPISLALNNALFKTTPVNGCLLFGEFADDFIKIKNANLFLTFGLYAYLPSLPDPYAANLNKLKYQFRGNTRFAAASAGQTIWLWLVCRTKWIPATEENDSVEVSFHFAPLQNQFQIEQTATVANPGFSNNLSEQPFVKLFSSGDTAASVNEATGFENQNAKAYARSIVNWDLDELWQKNFSYLLDDIFALLDVSSNADQMGVSFASFGQERFALMRTHFAVNTDVAANNIQFPIQVQGMDVVTRGLFAKAFMLPQISWEPVMNLTDPNVINPTTPQIEPPLGPNYYPNDGGATRILNNSTQFVPLAPIPLTDFIVDKFKIEKGNITVPIFTLPWGMRAIAILNKDMDNPPAKIENNRKSFPNNLKGGIQLQFNAGLLSSDRYPLFHGGTLQLNNILNVNGQKTNTSNLGDSVSFIFNQEFAPKINDLVKSRGVPLTRMDLSGYGASIFSNWFNPDAQFAQTSQAKFDVFVGRTAHEVIQVRSMIHKWGIRVVRTIILYRSGSGYVYRVDTGWKAESDGLFDYSYRLRGHSDFPASKDFTKVIPVQDSDAIHPGVIKGVFNVKNIVEVGEKFNVPNFVKTGQYYVDENNIVQKNTGAPLSKTAVLKEVEFDCDIEIEGIVQGAVNGRVPCKKMKGYVQLAPMGIPISEDCQETLHTLVGGSIGGAVDCTVDIGGNGQLMRITRVDTNPARDATGVRPQFVAAARGSVILPKDGSWSTVMHKHDSGEVIPLPDNITAPLIRIGQVIANVFDDPDNPAKDKYTLSIDVTTESQLLRIANPTEILRQPTNGTTNFGLLQTTSTQKALFLTPSFKKLANATDPAKLLSKTPPLFADAYRMISAKGIFPNIGDAVTSFGDAIALDSNFAQNGITDAGKQVYELMQINLKDGAGKILQEGYKLLKQVENLDFPLPDKWMLIDEDYLKIYVEYKATRKVNNNPQTDAGKLNFDIDSFANNVADNWKSKLSNLSMVLDLGPFDRLMTIRGNFDSEKGKEASYKGSESDPTFPAPQIEFSPVLQTVMDILQILQDLQGEKYGDAVKKGLKIAMSNSADSWEYKFEASKEIPVVKFPIPESVYNAPTTPLKLEAGLKIGVYFNAALKVTTEPGKLLPTAGAFLDFGARLSVMCVSLAAATVYAVGQANVGIAADTKVGPSLKMKFGFGAQIVVGLPVIANVSVLYMVGVEIYADSTQIIVTASLLFQGHADILGGIVSVTITIEAKGSVKRIGDRTDCSCQVTFALEISVFLIIDINISESWQENRQVA